MKLRNEVASLKKKRIITLCAVALVILAASAFYLNRAAIFQRGNPIPYLISAVQISEENPYVAVDETKGIYISKPDVTVLSRI